MDTSKVKNCLLMALGIAAMLVSGCAAGITRTGYQLPKDPAPMGTNQTPIAIQRNVAIDTNNMVVLGSIHSYDTGFSTECDEAYTLDIFCHEGRMLGADLVNITHEKHPDVWSTCYRADAQFLRFKDREKVKTLRSDPNYEPQSIIDRSLSADKRNREYITGLVFGGILGGIIVWQATEPHDPHQQTHKPQ